MNPTPTVQISNASLEAMRAFARTMSTACLLGVGQHAEALLLESVAAGRLLLHLLSEGVLTPADLNGSEEDEELLPGLPTEDDDERTIMLQNPLPAQRPHGTK